MKYKTIGAFKNVQNMPYCKTTSDMKIGIDTILDRVVKAITLPIPEDDAKKVVYTVINVNDKPEPHNSSETYVVNEGEYVCADDLRTVNGFEVGFAAFEANGGTTGLAAEGLLVFGADGRIVKAVSAGGYVVYPRVICKAPYMDDGIFAEIVAQ